MNDLQTALDRLKATDIDDYENIAAEIERLQSNFDTERASHLATQAALRAACGTTRKTPPNQPGLWFWVRPSVVDPDEIIIDVIRVTVDGVWYIGNDIFTPKSEHLNEQPVRGEYWQGPLAPLPEVTPF